jgi:RHS repeat-associated protein
MKLLPGWVRSKRALRWTAVVAAFAVAVSLTLITVVPGPRPGPPNAGILAPGSQGSLPQQHHSWWDPRGWFGGNRAPTSHVVPGTAAGLPSRPRVLREVTAPPVRRVGEVVAKRTEFSRTYELSDGRRQAVISTVPVNYRDAAGRWEPVTTAVARSGRPGFTWQNVTNTFGSFFGADPARLVRFEVAGGGWLQVGLAGARPVPPRVAGDVVAYPGILPGVTLSYQVTPAELKERIVLASPSAGAGLRFAVRAGGGLTPAGLQGGGIGWSRDGTDVPVLVIPAPVMTDSSTAASSPNAGSPVAQRVSWDAATSVLSQMLLPDRRWLDAAGRVFPVTVDPTIEIAPTPSQAQNVMIAQDNPTANYGTSSWPMEVGTTSTGAVRSLVSFPLTSIPSGTQIDSADLNLYWDQSFGAGTANQTVNAYQATSSWSASSVTWSTGPGVGAEGMNQVLTDDSDTAHTSASGAWPSQADSSAISGEYRYDQDATAGDTFTWAPPLTEPGTYQVEDHYVANSAAASNAPFTVHYSGGSATFTVNQQSGTGGVWATLGSEPFAAGTAGTVVLGDGPASTSVRVQADAVRLTKYGSVTDVPISGQGLLAGNRWDSFAVRNIVQSWLNGTAANDGFVLAAASESTLGVGGPVYERSGYFYQGETVNYPQLVVTYGLPSVTVNPITTITATGADLSWAPYVNPNPGNPGANLAEYQVYRSVFQAFTPSPDTLVSPVPAGTTSFDDTTAVPTPAGASMGNAYYYMVAVKTQDGTIVPGPVQLVRLPVGAQTTVIIPATGAATLSSAQPGTNIQNIAGQAWLETGNNSGSYGVTRSVFAFPSLASSILIPAGSVISDAHLKLWGWYNNPGGAPSAAVYEAHNITQSGFSTSTATWNSMASGFDPSPAGTVTNLTNDPNRENFDVTAIAQGWLNTPSSQNGLLLKVQGETGSDPQDRELWLGTGAPEQALAPALVVTYLPPTPQSTYYAPDTPGVSASASSYTTSVTVTNTTGAAWSHADDWELTYHWLDPAGNDVTIPYTSSGTDQALTPLGLTSDLPAGGQVTVNAAVATPDITGSGNSRLGYQLAWDVLDKTTGKWVSSGTTTANLSGIGSAGAPSVLAKVTSVAETAEQLGLEKYYQYTGVATGSGSVLEANDATGNVVWNYNPFSNPSNGFRTFVRLDYNSMDTTESSMGFGWSLQASTLTRVGTPLDFHPRQNPTTVTLTDGNGGSHTFTWNSTSNQWQSPVGFHYFLQRPGTCDLTGQKQDNPAKAWLITAPDRTQFYFDCQGYQTAVVDKNGNESDFTYSRDGNGSQSPEMLNYITDPAKRQTLKITYFQKGGPCTYYDHVTGKWTTTLNLTLPDIIDQVASITDVSGRELDFGYSDQGLLMKLTDGAGPGWTGPATTPKVFQFGYDPTQGNKNVKLVSVTDPRTDPGNHTTNLVFCTATSCSSSAYKWWIQSITDRRANPLNFAYQVVPAGTNSLLPNGGLQTQVTDALSHTTTYLTDPLARPVQIINPRGYKTTLSWDSDNNVATLTEDNGAVTSWTWDQNTGYPLTMQDAANAGTSLKYVYSYQYSLTGGLTSGGHVADLTSLLTPQQRLWTFGYDPSTGNLKTVTKPLGNVSGATAGSYTTTYQYNPDGTLYTAQDPDGNLTTYTNYDPTGYPKTITDARQHATSYVYSPTGNVTSVTDAYNKTMTMQYDVFGRPGQQVIPKGNGQTITIAAPVYDGNDNITTSYAPSYSSSTPGPATTYQYNPDDELIQKATPPDTTGGQSPTTTYSYYPDHTLNAVIRPLGNVTGATPSQYTTTYAYYPDKTLQTVTDSLGGKTSYAYDDVANVASVTDPNTNQTQYLYNPDHQLTQVKDANNKTTITGYDHDGLVDQVTDTNNNITYYTLDADGQVVQQEVPAQPAGSTEVCGPSMPSPPPAGCDVSQYVYDQAGNRTQVLTPRAVANGDTTSSSCANPTSTSYPCPYTWITSYNPDNQVDAVQTPANPGDPVYSAPQVTTYKHDNDDRLSQVVAPASNGSLSVPNTTSYQYFDNGWLQNSTDPRGVTTTWDYNARGEQTQRTLSNAGVTAMSRGLRWSYYPDGKLQAVTDNGVPTGMYAEVVDNTDTSNASWTPTGTAGTTAWPSATCPAGQCDGYTYQTHAATSTASTDTFTWHLNIPADGKYTIYVKYPALPAGSTAATSAPFKVTYSNGSGGTASTTVNVNQQLNTGKWFKLGEWSFTRAGTGWRVTLTPVTPATAGTVVANAVEAIRDNSTDTNSAIHGYSYQYDVDGVLRNVTETKTTGTTITTVGSDVITPDVLDRTQTVQENNGSGAETHITGYTYRPGSQVKTMSHDIGISGATPSYASYAYNNLNQLQQESDGTSATDSSPKVTSFTYTPTGQLATELKPNNNLVTDTYYADNQRYTQTEYTKDSTTTGTLVSSHTYQYDPNGNQTQDIQKLMSGDNSASYLSHTLNYTYNPLDQLATLTTDGTQTEKYYHDPEGNVTSQTTNGTTSYSYDRGLLETSATGGSTAYYNYDPLGRLDTITSGSPGGTILETNTYDGFDNLVRHTQGSIPTSYTYDPLNRLASQTTGTSTTSYAYLGLTNELAKETDPGSQTKNYSYTPGGMRLFQTTTSSTGTVTPGYYSYNNHGDVEAVTGTNGNTTATYGYTAYGSNITSMFTGADKNNTSPGSSTTPYNSYRFNGMRWDPGSGQYDMGFRNYDSGLNSFISRDMYDGALSDVSLTTDPFTGSRYAFGDGNPISNIELDGHMFPAGGGAAGCPYGTIGCLGYHPSSTRSGAGGNQPNCWEGSYCVPQPQLPPGWSFQRSGPWSGVITHTWQQRECSRGGARTGAPFCWTQTNQEQFNIGTVCGGGARTGAPHCYPASDFLTPSQGKAVFWTIIVAAGLAGLGAALDAAIGAAEEGLPELSTDTAQLEAKFKHAADFGITEPRGVAGFKAFGKAIDTFVSDPATVRVMGTYHGDPAILNYNPSTAQVVVQAPDGSFITGWRMSPAQLWNVIERGSLGGG